MTSELALGQATALAIVGAVGVLLAAAHHVADYWGQTSWMAATKAEKGLVGWLACGVHVLVHVALSAAALGVLAARTGWRPSPVAMAVGLGLIGVTHFVADRRHPLKALAGAIGLGDYWAKGGAAHLDQSWHIAWLTVATLVIA